jgi:hypothetical protein
MFVGTVELVLDSINVRWHRIKTADTRSVRREERRRGEERGWGSARVGAAALTLH